MNILLCLSMFVLDDFLDVFLGVVLEVVIDVYEGGKKA